ncbi:MAG: universal stress protein [Chloroflexota bacterium]
MRTILVPLDGSALADRAVPFAATIAEKAGWSLLLLRAVNAHDARSEVAAQQLRTEAQQALNTTAEALQAKGLDVVTLVADGPPEPTILATVADKEIGLVVMSTHGRSGLGRFVYGSVTDTILRHATVPVLTIPPHGIDAWATAGRVKIMVPLDGSELSRAALGPACELADALGGSILLASVVVFPSASMYAEGYVYVDPDPDQNVLAEARTELQQLADTLRTEGRPVEVCASYGSPYFGITSIARDNDADLIVMATHGRGGMTRALLGSVATAMIRQTEIPIMLVRPPAVEEPHEAAPTTPGASAATAHAETAPSTVTLTLTPGELELLKTIVGQRCHAAPIDPPRAGPAQLLLEKLRAAGPH